MCPLISFNIDGLISPNKKTQKTERNENRAHCSAADKKHTVTSRIDIPSEQMLAKRYSKQTDLRNKHVQPF